jgi:lipid-binding SYLF domain-containing protein
VVLVFKNRNGLDSLLNNKFKIGADAGAAAGPVGRHAEAATDAAMHAQILTYSRSRGAFAGISLNGSVVQPDESGNRAMYPHVTWEDILAGKAAVPEVARPLTTELSRFEVMQK